MTKAEIAQRIREFLEREFPDHQGQLTDSTHLLEEFFLDSFGVIDTVMFLETAFGVRVERADINGSNFANIDTLSEFVARRLAG